MEFLLYGLPKGETERYTEDLLAVRSTRQDAESVIERAKVDGWHSFRIATFDGSPPNFVGAITKRGTK